MPELNEKSRKIICPKCGRLVKITKAGCLPKHLIKRWWTTNIDRLDHCPWSGREFKLESEEQPKPKRIAFTFDHRSRITEDEAQEAAEFAGLKLPKIPLCTCGYGGGPSPAHRGDCPMRVWE